MLGSEALNNSVDWLVQQARAEGLSAWTEETVPHTYWRRGEESASIVAPLLPANCTAECRQHPLKIVSLGFSSGTPAEGVQGELVVASTFDELRALGAANKTQGKVVLLNPVWKGYGNTVAYRGRGAQEAAEVGAVAVLVRSMSSFSLGNPHTGGGGGDEDAFTPIPSAALAVEDADYLARLVQLHGRSVTVNVKLVGTGAGGAAGAPKTRSRCVVAQLNGTDLAHEVVLLSGHLDSWDVGQGALDDGSGLAISWRALALLQRLGLRARRTVRFVGWAGEEWGIGAEQYWNVHRNGAESIILAAESDSGVFAPKAWELTGTVEAHAYARAVGQLVAAAGGVGAVVTGGEGADIAQRDPSIPGVSLDTDANAWFRYKGEWDAEGPAGAQFQGDYFYYHHSTADTMSLLDPGQMDAALATWTAFAFVIANVSVTFPQGNATVRDEAALLAALGPPPAAVQRTPAVCGPDWVLPPQSPPPAPPPCSAGCKKCVSPFAWVIVILSTALATATATRWYTLRTLRGSRVPLLAPGREEDAYASLLTADDLATDALPPPHELEAAAMAESAAPRPPITM